jgi:hypothetical protein
MKTVIALLLALFNTSEGAEDLPDFAALSSELFEKREEAQEAIFDWVMSNHDTSKEVLLEKYLKTDDPEIRFRLVPLLERSYFKPKGYVGIIMSPELKAPPVQPGGKAPRVRPLGQVPQAREYHGVLITKVFPGTPAEISGLKNDDVIFKINDWEVRGGFELTSDVAAQIQKNPPQTPINLQVKRAGEMITIELKLGILPTPSERLRDVPRTTLGLRTTATLEIEEQMQEFRNWLDGEIDKERKNLIADRRL